MAHHLVLTDMHFGSPESAINRDDVRAVLVSHIASQAPWDQIVLAGDILDANLSTLRRSIEGAHDEAVCGFRQFLAELHRAGVGRDGRGLPGIAKRWVYVPGNHDYKVWDILASRFAFEDTIQAGKVFGADPALPVKRQAWTGSAAFISGLWKGAGFDASASVTVEYPDHRIAFGPDDLVVTHGHYLDPLQTRFSDLSDCLRAGMPARDAAEVVRRIVIETAQYQAVAHAMSFRRDSKEFVDSLFGPASLPNKVKKILSAIGDWIAALFNRARGDRGAELSPKLLKRVDLYVEHFAAPPDPAREVKWFVFGHTHVQGAGVTPGQRRVWNAGSCYDDHGRVVTFAEIEQDGVAPRVKLQGIARSGAGWAVVAQA